MNILIDTGVVDLPQTISGAIQNIDGEHNVSEPKIYPSDGPALIAVGVGQMAVVTAYFADIGDPTTQEVEVYKVLTTSGVPASGGAGCCPLEISTEARVLRRAKLCGWELKDCSPVLVVTTPGKYQFEPNEEGADVVITAQILPTQEFNRGLDYSIR